MSSINDPHKGQLFQKVKNSDELNTKWIILAIFSNAPHCPFTRMLVIEP